VRSSQYQFQSQIGRTARNRSHNFRAGGRGPRFHRSVRSTPSSGRRDDVYAEQAALTAEVVRAGSDGLGARERIDAWAAQNADAVERCLHVLADIKAAGVDDLARLSVAVREIRNLTQSSSAARSVEPVDVQSVGV
jgi:hypothetical protein